MQTGGQSLVVAHAHPITSSSALWFDIYFGNQINLHPRQVRLQQRPRIILLCLDVGRGVLIASRKLFAFEAV